MDRDKDRKITTPLSTPVSDIIFTAFDIETTGLNPHTNAILEIGAVQFKERELINTFHTLINPGEGVENAAAAINNITSEMLQGQPSIAEALPRFVSFVADTVLVGHNVYNFDIPFVRTHLARLSLPPLYNHIADTYTLARKVFPIAPYYSLKELAISLSIEQHDAHRALDDAITCRKLFHRIVEELSFMGDSPPLSKLIV